MQIDVQMKFPAGIYNRRMARAFVTDDNGGVQRSGSSDYTFSRADRLINCDRDRTAPHSIRTGESPPAVQRLQRITACYKRPESVHRHGRCLLRF